MHETEAAGVFGSGAHGDPDQPADHGDALRPVADGDRGGGAIGARVDPTDPPSLIATHTAPSPVATAAGPLPTAMA
jgi:hypothetical protein